MQRTQTLARRRAGRERRQRCCGERGPSCPPRSRPASGREPLPTGPGPVGGCHALLGSGQSVSWVACGRGGPLADRLVATLRNAGRAAPARQNSRLRAVLAPAVASDPAVFFSIVGQVDRQVVDDFDGGSLRTVEPYSDDAAEQPNGQQGPLIVRGDSQVETGPDDLLRYVPFRPRIQEPAPPRREVRL